MPARLHELDLIDGRVLPRWLTTRDVAWVEALQDVVAGSLGLRRGEVRSRLARLVLPDVPRRRRAWVEWTLLSIHRFSIDAARRPSEVRAVTFALRAEHAGLERERVLELAARRLSITPADVERSLLADRFDERRLGASCERLSAIELVHRANLELLRSLLRRARRLEVRVEGPVRPVLRHARLHGLMATLGASPAAHLASASSASPGSHASSASHVSHASSASPGSHASSASSGSHASSASSGSHASPASSASHVSPAARASPGSHASLTARASARIVIDGPLSPHVGSARYGRAFARFVPALTRAPRWSLATDLPEGELRASDRDPVGTTQAPPRRFDSAVERRLFEDLHREGSGWHVVREGRAVQPRGVGASLTCPDFVLERLAVDGRPAASVAVEVVGFWTPDYLSSKLRLLRALPPTERWIVCVDRSLGPDALERFATLDAVDRHRLLPFRRRVPAAELLEIAEQLSRCDGAAGG